MLLDCLRYLLTFLLLIAAAPQSVTTAYADGLAVDQAPVESLSVGNRTPEPTDIEPGVLFAKPLVSHTPWPETVHEPVVVSAPRCVRRSISRLHWVRRRVPRLRDDASDH